MIPEIVHEYMKFCRIREKSKTTNIIDLSSFSWFYPTSLLPLANFLRDNMRSMGYISPPDNVSNYISIIMERSFLEGSTYIPITNLPKNGSQIKDILNNLRTIYDNGEDYGGANCFNYLIGELIDNVYEHSEFSTARVMAQKYINKRFVEISILDDGISIPGCFEKHDAHFSDDCIAIASAINGKSTKDDGRGFGLGSSVKLYVDGLCGELLLVSRNGALYKNRDKELKYNTGNAYQLHGTLISIRVPYPVLQIDNIYDYIDG
ncbi:MAG: ATP-binding protein [Euryarchaeota archaeon]|nr:ATP-binding protein [Euryarchaeota archaeon]